MKTRAKRCHACGVRVKPEDEDWLRFQTSTYFMMYFCSLHHMKLSVLPKSRTWKRQQFWMLRDWPVLFEYED